MANAREVAGAIETEFQSERFREYFSIAAAGVQIIETRVEGDRVLIVYSRPEMEGQLGLDIGVREDASVEDEVLRIVMDNIGEPLGSFSKDLKVDENGVRWWAGEPPEWHEL